MLLSSPIVASVEAVAVAADKAVVVGTLVGVTDIKHTNCIQLRDSLI